MQLNPSEISELIKKRIEGFEATSEARSEGTLVSLTDGICRIHGLADVMQGEMIDFGNNLFGLALNLERDSVGAVILGDYKTISEGDKNLPERLSRIRSSCFNVIRMSRTASHERNLSCFSFAKHLITTSESSFGTAGATSLSG